MNTSGKTVLITGGGSGIGLALAEALLAQKNTVMICGRDRVKLETARAKQPALHAIRCDINCTDDVRMIREKIETAFGGLDMLVNNAALNGAFSFVDGTDDLRIIEEQFSTNVIATLKLTKLFLPLLLKQHEAAIVNISSVLSFIHKPSVPIYAASKAALHSATKSLRAQLEKTSVRVFEVFPPLVDTAMTRDRGGPKMSAEKLAHIILSGLAGNRYEMRPGFAQPVYLLNRLAPGVVGWIAGKV